MYRLYRSSSKHAADLELLTKEWKYAACERAYYNYVTIVSVAASVLQTSKMIGLRMQASIPREVILLLWENLCSSKHAADL